METDLYLFEGGEFENDHNVSKFYCFKEILLFCTVLKKLKVYTPISTLKFYFFGKTFNNKNFKYLSKTFLFKFLTASL